MQNWIYGVIGGIVIAIILVIILCFTAFKGKNMAWFYIIIIALFGACGGVINYYCFNDASATTVTPQEQVEAVVDTITDTWSNTNGGFTFEQIQAVQDDDEAPTYDDQIIGLSCSNFGDYIVFSYETDGTYQNLLFYCSNEGLILDGMINMHSRYKDINFYVVCFSFDLSSYYWTNDEMASIPTYSTQLVSGKRYDNLVSLSRQTARFCYDVYNALCTNKTKSVNYALTEASYLTGKNATANFIKFGDVELIGTASTGYVKINSFFNYLYEQIKGSSYGTTKIIDATSCFCVPIASSLQSNYPISEDKQAEYGGAEYYGVYNCDIAVELTYIKGNSQISGTTTNENYFETLKEDESTSSYVEVEEVEASYSYTKLKLSFTNSQSSDISSIDLASSPITITFTCSALDVSKTITISDTETLDTTFELLLNSNQTWQYLISSEDLIFEDYRGSFTISSKTSNLNFEYYYLNGYTFASVGLNAIGTIDESEIDLATNPVTIYLTNADNTYQFVFNTNSQLNSYVSQVVALGTYDYTILSNQLIFASETGSLTITTTDKIMLFNYTMVASADLTFNLELSTSIKSVVSDSSLWLTPIFADNYTYVSAYSSVDITFYVYDDGEKLIYSYTDEARSVSTLGTSLGLFDSELNLVEGSNYIYQVKFSFDDSSVVYLTNAVSFTFLGTSYNHYFTLTISEN